MAFKPGQSGNPNGRPKRIDASAEKCRAHTDAAIQVWVKQLASDDEAISQKAAAHIIERAYGKATEYVESQVEDTTPEKPEAKPRFTLEELRLLISELQSRRA